MVLVTDGAGFIGSNFELDWLALFDKKGINLALLDRVLILAFSAFVLYTL